MPGGVGEDELLEELLVVEQKARQVFEKWDQSFARGYPRHVAEADRDELLQRIAQLKRKSEKLLGLPILNDPYQDASGEKAGQAMEKTPHERDIIVRLEETRVAWKNAVEALQKREGAGKGADHGLAQLTKLVDRQLLQPRSILERRGKLMLTQ
eukprot:g47157.t1